jgi:hypothetical protein
MRVVRFVAGLMVVAAVALAARATYAHHAFAAEFDRDKPITLVGTLTKVAWVNPHGWIYVDVKGPDGKVTNWGIEFGAPASLIRRGLRKTDFPIGIEVKVQGFLAKSGRPVANASTVVLPDGRELFAGSSTTPGGESADQR